MTGRAGGSINDRWQVSRRNPDGTRRRSGVHIGPLRITPWRITVVVALVGSAAFLAYAITVRDASQIPLLVSGAAVLGIVFTALAIGGGVSTYRAAREGRGARAFLLAISGGFAGLLAFGCFAGATILTLVYRA